MHSHRTQSGITLIELLVVVTLLGMVSLGLLFAMRVGVGAWQRANARMTTDRKVTAAGDLITSQLGSVRAKYVVWGNRDQSLRFIYFEGRSDRLRFLSDDSVMSRTRGGLWLAEYWFEHNARNECRLQYNEFPVRTDADLAPTIAGAIAEAGSPRIQFRPTVAGPATRMLYAGLHDCAFEYLIEPLDGKPVYWGKEWPSDQQKLPRAVAVRFSAKEDHGIAPIATVATLNAREVWPQ
jgi:prepilin-type N-terminal cleavage/methylation domain-containing protein